MIDWYVNDIYSDGRGWRWNDVVAVVHIFLVSILHTNGLSGFCFGVSSTICSVVSPSIRMRQT